MLHYVIKTKSLYIVGASQFPLYLNTGNSI